MRTITISPGEEIRIVCEGEEMNNNKNNNNNANNERSNSNSNSNIDEDFVDENSVSGGKRGRKANKTRKSSKKSARKTTQTGGKKRAPNGYMKFASEMRPQILKENPELKSDVVSVARKIGAAWRKLPESERKKY